jgi:hypothetical protein
MLNIYDLAVMLLNEKVNNTIICSEGQGDAIYELARLLKN